MLLLSTVSTGNHKGAETDDETTENSSVKGKKEKKRKKEKKKQRLETETEHKKKHKKRKKYKLKEETWLLFWEFLSSHAVKRSRHLQLTLIKLGKTVSASHSRLLACVSRVTSRDSSKLRACLQASKLTSHSAGKR